ncbi:hypothetical protein AURDEDRAFT_170885 [Auricularia subglabra TFB-10046 SS5]|nr:hypothetical protein AURDEDRAFT_170885 [Auricularia subglabra TFB-10046 SS5]
MSATRVLAQEDLLYTLFDQNPDIQALARLGSVSRKIRSAAVAAMQRTYPSYGCLRWFFPLAIIPRIQDFLRGGAIIAGTGVKNYLSRMRQWRENIILFVPHADFDAAASLLDNNGYRPCRAWTGNPDGTDWIDDSEPFRSYAYARSAEFLMCTDTVWLVEPRVSPLHGVLHLRYTGDMNGLTMYGFFSLYPACTFFRQTGALTHIRFRGDPPSDTRPFGRLYRTGFTSWFPAEGATKPPRSLMPGPRVFGDGHSWLISSPIPGTEASKQFGHFGNNTWAMGEREFWDKSSPPGRVTELTIWTSVLQLPCLDHVYVGTAALKAYITRVLATIESADTERAGLDKYLSDIIASFTRGSSVQIDLNGQILSLNTPVTQRVLRAYNRE